MSAELPHAARGNLEGFRPGYLAGKSRHLRGVSYVRGKEGRGEEDIYLENIFEMY